MPSQRVYFENSQGIRLAGILDTPDQSPQAFALFTHCFTCTKDLKAIVRISRGLAKQGIAVLRFDFTGLGDSHGSFAESNFETNQDDILSAVTWLAEQHQSPKLLIGLSLGGAALMSVVNKIDSVRALVTLAAPSDTSHLAGFLARTNPDIEQAGSGEVVIGGRTHMMTSQLLASLRRQNLQQQIESIQVPHLIMHSPNDATLDFRHAENLFAWTGGEKSFVTLPGSDHLLVSHPDDVGFVADLIATWASRMFSRTPDEWTATRESTAALTDR